ncbi:hypothetical protein M501DRAFT_1009576 [Patellaria atrata CBS 101060]|uniref:Uncharacterized protein n=1 Tax=Patellaria atrata CBS 101060 TaxID=1346257 RepID=A0A9P4SH67_9PEZI|nr:hypothetical protein M501DRAFT_1009576 [Patellaria atrata CBS 101060]
MGDIKKPTVATPLYSASYRNKNNQIELASPNDSEYLQKELSVTRLNEISEHLWLVGLPMPPRPLHVQKIKMREIVITEQTDLHLVWSPRRIYIKPIPRFLLQPKVWEEYLCKSHQLYSCAMGFLQSYTALIQHQSDFKLATEAGLLPEELTWPKWTVLVAQFLTSPNVLDVNKRYKYGELRLGRLNLIYRLRMRKVRGYLSSCTTYGDFFRDNVNSLITLFAYTTIALSAMQVGLGTTYLQDNEAFHAVSYGFSVFAIIAPLALIVALVLVLLGLVLQNLIATLVYNRRFHERRKQQRRKADLGEER